MGKNVKRWEQPEGPKTEQLEHLEENQPSIIIIHAQIEQLSKKEKVINQK
jgi:hypothetical protein